MWSMAQQASHVNPLIQLESSKFVLKFELTNKPLHTYLSRYTKWVTIKLHGLRKLQINVGMNKMSVISQDSEL